MRNLFFASIILFAVVSCHESEQEIEVPQITILDPESTAVFDPSGQSLVPDQQLWITWDVALCGGCNNWSSEFLKIPNFGNTVV